MDDKKLRQGYANLLLAERAKREGFGITNINYPGPMLYMYIYWDRKAQSWRKGDYHYINVTDEDLVRGRWYRVNEVLSKPTPRDLILACLAMRDGTRIAHKDWVPHMYMEWSTVLELWLDEDDMVVDCDDGYFSNDGDWHIWQDPRT